MNITVYGLGQCQGHRELKTERRFFSHLIPQFIFTFLNEFFFLVLNFLSVSLLP